MMRFYDRQHRFYAGIDLHARFMHVCVLDATGNVVFDHNLPCDFPTLLDALAPYREDLVIGAECMFGWYWLADRCAEENIPFLLGHALYMKLIHGGKAKNDRLDAHKIARLLKGGNFPLAYVYPKGMREMSVTADLDLIDKLDELIGKVELYLKRSAKVDDVQTYHRLQTVPGCGPILALVLLYEMHDLARFEQVGQFLSYARLVRPEHESNGKKLGWGGKKIGNAHLRWAFAEVACLFLRSSERAKQWKQRQEKKHGSGKTLGILAARLARSVFHMIRKREAFDEERFWGSQGLSCRGLIIAPHVRPSVWPRYWS
jgi:transposase